MTNTSKCYILATSGTISHSHSYGDYCLGGNRITISNITRALGIIMVNSSWKFQNHVNCAITKANCTLVLLTEHFSTDDQKWWLNCTNPQLKYGNIIYITDQKSIEGVQRCATKMIPHSSQYTYQQRLQFLKLPSMVIGGWEVTWFCCIKLQQYRQLTVGLIHNCISCH